jgi:hypothetical protein
MSLNFPFGLFYLSKQKPAIGGRLCKHPFISIVKGASPDLKKENLKISATEITSWIAGSSPIPFKVFSSTTGFPEK